MIPSKVRTAIDIAREQGIVALLMKIYQLYLLESVAKLLTYSPHLKDEELVLFGTRYGEEYEDNPKYVFEWFVKNESEISPVWTTQSNEVYEKLSNMDYPVVHQDSTKGVYTLMRASVGVVINDYRDLKLSSISRPEEFCLLRAGHDYPISRTEVHDDQEQQIREKKRREYSTKDYFIHTSEYQINLNRQRREYLPDDVFDCDKHIITGYPRTDRLLNSSDGFSNLTQLGRDFSEKRLILYSPTKRNPNRWDEPVDLFPFTDYDATSLNEFLERHDMTLLLRLHPADLGFLNGEEHPEWSQKLRVQLEELEAQSNVVRADHDTIPDVYTILSDIDYMITDYSSIFFDFLLLDRPILFFASDYESYLENKGGVTFDYFETIPGPHIESFDEFCAYLESCERGEDAYTEKRNALTDEMHRFQDGNSTERVSRLVKDLAGDCSLNYTVADDEMS